MLQRAAANALANMVRVLVLARGPNEAVANTGLLSQCIDEQTRQANLTPVQLFDDEASQERAENARMVRQKPLTRERRGEEPDGLTAAIGPPSRVNAVRAVALRGRHRYWRPREEHAGPQGHGTATPSPPQRGPTRGAAVDARAETDCDPS